MVTSTQTYIRCPQILRLKKKKHPHHEFPMTHFVWGEVIGLELFVCVCQTLFLRAFSPLPRVLVQAGALNTPWQTQCNEAMPWSGKHGLITRVYLRQFGTVERAVQFTLLLPWFFMLPTPKQVFPPFCSRFHMRLL